MPKGYTQTSVESSQTRPPALSSKLSDQVQVVFLCEYINVSSLVSFVYKLSLYISTFIVALPLV